MNLIDVLVLVIVVVSTLSSLRTGFLRQALALIGFVVGVYAALGHHETVAKGLSGAISNPSAAGVVAFVLILVAVWIAFALLARATRAALAAFGLAWADHFVGMLVGLAVGLFLSACILLLLVRIEAVGIAQTVQSSFLATLIFRALPHLRRLLPADLPILRSL